MANATPRKNQELIVTLAVQLQAVIAGPNSQGQAYVLLVNYSQDQSSGGFVIQIYGPQTCNLTVP